MESTCLTACGSMTRTKLPALPKPSADAASHCPRSTAFMPAFSVLATATENITENEMTATMTGSMSEDAKIMKFTMSSTTRLGTPSMSLQKALAAPAAARCRLLSTRHSPKPSSVPNMPLSTEISSVTPRPPSTIFHRSSRMKVFSKLSAILSKNPPLSAASGAAMTITVSTTL